MSRKVTDLINDHLIGEGSVKEGGKPVSVSGSLRKAALMQMGDRADDDGSNVWLSILRIAVWIECNERSGRRVMRSLENDGMIINTGAFKTMPNGAVMPIYRIDLDIIRSRPTADDLFREKTEAKVAKNKREVAARGARRATMAAPANDTTAAPNGESRATMAQHRATMAAEPVRTVQDLGSKEPKSESVDGFELTPSARDPKAKRGKETVPLKEPETVVEFYEKFRDADFYDAIPAAARQRTKRQQSIAMLGPVIEKHGRDVVAVAIKNYYVAARKIKNGENAQGLQNLIADGVLEDLIREVARKGKPVATGDGLSLDVAMQRLKSTNWRPAWGDKHDAIYDAARAAIAERAGGRSNAA